MKSTTIHLKPKHEYSRSDVPQQFDAILAQAIQNNPVAKVLHLGSANKNVALPLTKPMKTKLMPLKQSNQDNLQNKCMKQIQNNQVKLSEPDSGLPKTIKN